MSFDLVKEFHETFGVKIRKEANFETLLRVPEGKLRFNLIKEELGELAEAYANCDLVEVADALGDIEYVTIGAAQVFGVAEQVRTKFDVAYFEVDQWGEEFIRERIDMYLLGESHEEGLNNLRQAILTGDIEDVVDLLVSLLLTNTVTADYLRIPLGEVVTAIHESNMSKLGEDGEVIRRPGDNKVLKGPNYFPPTKDIERILFSRAYYR